MRLALFDIFQMVDAGSMEAARVVGGGLVFFKPALLARIVEVILVHQLADRLGRSCAGKRWPKHQAERDEQPTSDHTLDSHSGVPFDRFIQFSGKVTNNK